MNQPLSPGTPAHIDAAIIATMRSLSPVRKLELVRAINCMTDLLALAGIQRRRPTASQRDQGYALALQRLKSDQREHGAALLHGLPLVPTPADPLASIVCLCAALEACNSSHVVVGSVASVIHGEYRTIRDIDVMLNMAPNNVHTLVEGLRPHFTFLPNDITVAMLRLSEAEADWRQQPSFCAYDTASGFRVDVYLFSGSPFEAAVFQRAQCVDLPGNNGSTVRVASAEDAVLAKLASYRMKRADHAWRDVQAILRVQEHALDLAYLRQWAAALEFGELLEWALCGQQPPQPGEKPRHQQMA